MPEKMDKNVILALLAQADTKWYTSRSDRFNYRDHLEFIAEHIAKNYNKEAKKIST